MSENEFTIAAYRKALVDHKILACRCNRCNALYLPPRPICSNCHVQDMSWQELGGEGKILGFSSVAIPPSAMAYRYYGRTNPYLTALVELSEGPSIPARIEGADPKNPEISVQVGMPVQADFLEEESVRVGLRGKPTGRQVTLIFRPKS